MTDVSLKATQWYALVASDDRQYQFRLQSFKHALQVAIGNLIWHAIIPDWALGLYKKGKEIRGSFKELGVYMQEMIQSRKEALEQGLERSDLLSSLLRASVEGDKGALTDEELMGEFWTTLSARQLTPRWVQEIWYASHNSQETEK